LERYISFLTKEAGDARVVVFGHTHRPVNATRNGCLFFNPGSACLNSPEGMKPSLGILSFHTNGEVIGEILTIA